MSLDAGRPPVRSRAPLPGLGPSLVIVIGVAIVVALWNRTSTGSSPTPSVTAPGEAVATGTQAPLGPTAPASDPPFAVTIETDLQVKWNAGAAASRVLEFIAANEKRVGRAVAVPRIISVDAVSGKNTPNEIGGGGLDEYPVVWIVHALGTFTNDFGPVTVDPGGEGLVLLR